MKQFLKNHPFVTAVVMSFLVILTSCQKQVEVQEFDDVFDTSNIQALNEWIEKANSYSDLPSEFKQAEIIIPEGLKNVKLTDLIAHFSNNNKLSPVETDLLLKNDITTYMNVIDRMCSFPEQLKALNLDFSGLKKSPLNKYLLVQKEPLENFYEDDYYQSIRELQGFIDNHVIRPMSNFQLLAEKSANLKSGKNEDIQVSDEPLYCVLITSNAMFDMWWAYWDDGKKKVRTKHKGASGSFPG